MIFTRNCPNCGKEIIYKNEKSLKAAIKNNRKCRSCPLKGKKRAPLSEETKRKLSIALKGNNNGSGSKSRLGIPHTKETKRKISIANKGNTNGRGKRTKETRIKMSIAKGGDGTLDKVWDNQKLRQWKKEVKERDNYTCQYCGATEVRLESHHVFPKIRFPKLAYEINNGITLCQSCHIKEHQTYATDYFKDLFQAFSDFD